MAQGLGNITARSDWCDPRCGRDCEKCGEYRIRRRRHSFLRFLLGSWIALFLLFPGVLEFIPIPALAGLLIYTVFKLLDLSHIFDYIRNFNKTSLIFFTTFVLNGSCRSAGGSASRFRSIRFDPRL